MSYDVQKDRDRRDERAHVRRQGELADQRRGDVLRELDKADFEVSEFEAEFIGSYLDDPENFFWTAKRRAVVDEMVRKYGDRLPLPKPDAALKLPEAYAGGCCWLLIEDGEQKRCNAPATETGRKGMPLCERHLGLQNQLLAKQTNRRRT